MKEKLFQNYLSTKKKKKKEKKKKTKQNKTNKQPHKKIGSLRLHVSTAVLV